MVSTPAGENLMPIVIARPDTIQKALNAACRATPVSVKGGGDRISVKDWELHQHAIIDELEQKVRETRRDERP